MSLANVYAPLLRPRFSRVRSLRASASIFMGGTSSEAARGASPTDLDSATSSMWMTNAREYGYMMMAAKRVQQRGINVNYEATFGNQANGDLSGVDTIALYQAHDPRITTLTGVQILTTASSVGGWPLRLPSGTTTDFRINITRPCNTFDVWAFCANGANAGTKELLISTVGDANEVTFTFTDAVPHKFTITVALGAHVLRLRTRTAGTENITILGIEPRDTTQAELRFIPAGARGWNTTSTYWSRGTIGSSSYGPVPQIARMQHTVFMEAFGANEDFSAAGSKDAFIGNLQRIWDAADAGGSKVISLLKPIFNAPYDGTGILDAGPYQENEVREAKRAAAQARGYQICDLQIPAGRRDIAMLNGRMRPDNQHYQPPWHADVGTYLGDYLYDVALPALGVMS